MDGGDDLKDTCDGNDGSDVAVRCETTKNVP